MEDKKSFFSIKTKIYIFVFIIILSMAAATSALAFCTSVNQIDRYYKRCATDNARNFSTMVDGDYLARLRETAESEEYQELREKAVQEENEDIIIEYLTEKGLWESYREIQDAIDLYIKNISDIKYIYVTAHGDENAVKDMFLVDSSDEPVYQTGYYEEREEELLGKDITNLSEPTITNGDWGWLCSMFSPVYDSEGRCVCVVGCDFDMENIMKDRQRFLIYLVLGTLVIIVVVQAAAVLFIKRIVADPIRNITSEMEKFRPAENKSYKEAGVIELDIKSRDEIGALYRGIHTMQTRIMDHLNDLSALQEDKLRAERDIMDKELQIGRLSKETQRDVLTGVGSKSAYTRKINELNMAMSNGDVHFALVMVDMNKLKPINDKHGHKAGDQYIRGCCRMVCEVFKHSPVYRIGGDEFVAVLQGKDYDDRIALVEKLRQNYDMRYNLKDKEEWFRYSAAVGMAENASYDTSAELVFKRADRSMYDDKAVFRKKYGNDR